MNASQSNALVSESGPFECERRDLLSGEILSGDVPSSKDIPEFNDQSESFAPPIDLTAFRRLIALSKLEKNSEARLVVCANDAHAYRQSGFFSKRSDNTVRLLNHSNPVGLDQAKTGIHKFATSDATSIDDAVELPHRNYECRNYSACLGIAAALDWDSFTCQGCNKTINQKLLWRAHNKIRNNRSLQELCRLPILA